MSIDAIMSQYRSEKIPEIMKDYRQVQQNLGITSSSNAIGYKHFGTLGSLLGMGLGTSIGVGVPKLLFEHSSKII